MFQSESILTQVRQTLLSVLEDERATIWVGYSGGMDSTVLLHCVKELNLSNVVKAIHVNHQLSANASTWSQHCQNFTSKHDIPLICEDVDVINTGKGLEQAARESRYQVYAKHMQPGDVLLLGHHLDDQLETFHYRLIRGAGLTGLLGIRPVREFSNGKIVRPLLSVSRAEVEGYAQKAGLDWVEDESNSDESYDRNFLRNQIFPLIRERWPHFAQKWLQANTWLVEANELLEEYAEEDLERLGYREERLGSSISLDLLMKLSSKRQKTILRRWVAKSGYTAPSVAHLEQLSMFHAEQDKEPALAWGQCELRRYAARLYLLSRLTGVSTSLHCINSHRVSLPGGGVLSLPKSLDLTSLSIRFRQGGERCKPLARNHSQQLKKLLQEYKLEPWLRDRVPLLYASDELIAVGDLFVCESSLSDAFSIDELSWFYDLKSNEKT